MSYLSETTLLVLQGDKTAFSFVFTSFYSDLVNYAFTFSQDREAAEEIVQDLFVKFWGNRQTLAISTSLRSFLIRSTQNRCIDRIRHQKYT